jgi:hypothetical protein
MLSCRYVWSKCPVETGGSDLANALTLAHDRLQSVAPTEYPCFQKMVLPVFQEPILSWSFALSKVCWHVSLGKAPSPRALSHHRWKPAMICGASGYRSETCLGQTARVYPTFMRLFTVSRGYCVCQGCPLTKRNRKMVKISTPAQLFPGGNTRIQLTPKSALHAQKTHSI